MAALRSDAAPDVVAHYPASEGTVPYVTAHTNGTWTQILLLWRRFIKPRAEGANRSRFAEQMVQPTVEEMIMAITPNKDQVKGELKDIGGKIQEEAGKLVGSKEQQLKGLKKQTEGKLQKAVGDAKEVVTDAITKS